MKLLIVFVLFFLHSAYADDSCSDQNLITEPNSPFQQMPVYDQDGNGICYAYTAAQLINYHQLKSGQNKSVHPLWAALKFSEGTNKKDISTGNTVGTLQQLIKFGICDEAIVTDALKSWTEKSHASEADIFDLIEQFASNIETAKKKKQADLTSEELNQALKIALNGHRKYCSKPEDLKDILPDLRELGIFSTAREMFSTILVKGCTNQTKPLDVPTPAYYGLLNDDLSELRLRLNKLQSPVSITYCSESLYKPKYDGINDRPANNANVAKNCGTHESIITGKKMVNGQCHYLLRNTWGSGFDSSTYNWKCLCKNKKDGTYKDDCTESLFNFGKYIVEGCWIPESTLSKNVIGLTSLGSP